MRGASKINIYDFPTLESRKPTRLYIDAHKESQWRDKGFYSVLEENPKSLLMYMITEPLGIESGKQNKYDSEYSRVCIESTKPEQTEKYLKHNPAGRMPLGFPALLGSEIQEIKKWMESGSPTPKTHELEKTIRNTQELSANILKWEDFFNSTSLKEKLVSRYFYEHLFLASLYFEEHPGVSFRLIRSRNQEPPFEEVGTSYPFSDPEGDFYYRLRPETNTKTHKNHIPFPLSEARYKKWKQAFHTDKWETIPEEMPAYGPAGSNPFTTFAAIPVKARYQLFLDNSAYFIMTFIKGPVCRGQTALNVINDHFWVFFMDPKSDVLVNKPDVYDKVAKISTFPAKKEESIAPLITYRDNYWKAVKEKFSGIRSMPALNYDSLWLGDKENLNANISVFRHFDSATVLKGLRGGVPKTVWVLDYHVFESIYYNLSAGYNVFGPLLHQLNSRLYMEISRVASEDLFLSFLRKNSREDLRRQWNLPVPDQKESTLKSLVDIISEDAVEKLSEEYVFEGNDIKTEIQFNDNDVKKDFLNQLVTRRFSQDQSRRKSLEEEKTDDHPVLQLSKLSAKTVQHLPDSIHLAIESDGIAKLWTLIHNRDHYNVSMLLFEDQRIRPENDTLSVIPGAASSYANLIIWLEESKLEEFIKSLEKSKSATSVWKTLKEYGLSRSDKNFWQKYNEVSRLTKNPETTERGYLDLNRYLNL